MRILQIGPFPPPNGGVQTNLKAIHDLLAERGHSASVIEVPRSRLESKAANVYKPGSNFHTLWLLATLKFDIVHFHIGGDLSFQITVLMLICGILPGCRSLITFHSGGYAAENARAAKPISFRGFAFRTQDHLIGVNPQIIEMFKAYGVSEQKISFVPPFVLQNPDPDIVIPAELLSFIEQHDPFLLTVGLLENEYALPLQINSMAEIRSKLPEAGLIILGWGSIENELRDLIASKSYAEHIFLTGDVDRNITLHLIKKAKILLRPTFFDGDAVSVREALFLQTPVIATDNGMRPAGVHLISAPPDTLEFVNKVVEVNMAESGPDPVGEAVGRENIHAVLNIYESILER